MISKDEIEQMRKYYRLSAAINMIDSRPKNIVLRILPKKPNPPFADIYHTLTLDAMFGREFTTQQMVIQRRLNYKNMQANYLLGIQKLQHHQMKRRGINYG